MATRNLVPRNSGEGSVGRLDKAWGTGVFDNLYFGGLMVSMDQNVRTSDDVEFASGNFTEALTLGGVDISKLGTSISQVESGAAEFLFFSDVVDNNGVTDKVYYNTPNSNLYLSGITVASASNLKVEVQWDGPNSDYMGEAFINNQKIPLQNIEQLGQDTRRFKGFIDNIDLEGKTKILAEANGRVSEISLNELGLGPEPSNILIDETSNATAKPGEELGSTHLKQGDTINVFVDFDTDDVSLIKIHNHGLAQEIDFSPYPLVNNGNIYTATIPVTVSNRAGSQSVAVQAINSFGSTGELKESTDFLHTSGTRDLDQTYPIISASDPSSYNGRPDGLREGESASFTNTILNWQSSLDSVLYEAQTEQISINNSGVFENTKTVNYEDGIYNNSDNVEIHAIRINNGATDTDLVKVKIANGPEITGATLSSTASSASPPHSVGLNEIKAGDTVNSEVFIDGKGIGINNISLSIQNEGVSNGSQSSYSSNYTKATLPDGSFKFSVPINVYGTIGSASRDGPQPASIIVKNNFGTLSDKFTTSDTATLNNGDFPTLLLSSVDYPVNQSALKNSETATINFEKNNIDILHIDDNGLGGAGQLDFDDKNQFDNIELKRSVFNVRMVSLKGHNRYGQIAQPTNQQPGTMTVDINNSSPYFSNYNNLRLNWLALGGNFSFSTSGSTLIVNVPMITTTRADKSRYYPAVGTVSNWLNTQTGISAVFSSAVVPSTAGLQNVSHPESPVTRSISSIQVNGANGLATAKKDVLRLAGSYNVSVNNFTISGIKTSNGVNTSISDTVNIANSPTVLSVNNLSEKISSSPAGISDQFNLHSSQLMLEAPTLDLDQSQLNKPNLISNTSGTSENSNSYTITVSDTNTKGTFAWRSSALNLAGIETTIVSNNPNYTIEGFSSRTTQASPNSLGAGLSNIGTTVSNTNNISFENISEGGTAPNGGTFYTYQSYADGIQLDNSYDENNKFTICNSNGITDSDGDHVFNLDKLNRSANTSTSNPASFVISE
jgi:hypothetical protein